MIRWTWQNLILSNSLFEKQKGTTVDMDHRVLNNIEEYKKSQI